MQEPAQNDESSQGSSATAPGAAAGGALPSFEALVDEARAFVTAGLRAFLREQVRLDVVLQHDSPDGTVPTRVYLEMLDEDGEWEVVSSVAIEPETY